MIHPGVLSPGADMRLGLASCHSHWDKHPAEHFIKLNGSAGFYFNHNNTNELNIASCNNKS